MSAHTPGPWRVGDAGHTVFGPRKPDATLPVIIAQRLDSIANARLIAAAPELLAALTALANREWSGEEKSWRTEALEMRDFARAALAKVAP